MAKFAEYGFNKSHSAAYGMLTYQTAYLKTHYPSEFMAALMTTEMDNTDKITKYIGDARQHLIPVLPPDVNYSQKRFSVEVIQSKETGKSTKGIRFGLEAIKGVGGIAVDSILEARSNGKFKSVLDFCKRVSTRKANKKVVESLCLAGALDEIAEVNRASLFASLEALLEHAGDEQEERELGQSSLFDSFSSDEIKLLTPVDAIFKQEPEWPSAKKLTMEKEVVGFYVSGHPMDGWQKICEQWLGWSTERLKLVAAEKSQAKKAAPVAPENSWGNGPVRMRPPKTEVRLGGLLSELKEVTTKKGSRMAFAQLEDLKGKVEIVFFPDTYTAVQEILKRAVTEAEAIVVTGECEFGEDAPKVLAKQLEWAAEAHKNRVQQMTIQLVPAEVSPDQLRELKKQLLQSRGKCPVKIDFVDQNFQTSLALPKTLGVVATPQTVLKINKIFGKDVVTLH
jgi:DNA polymerase-3 subunit alpha